MLKGKKNIPSAFSVSWCQLVHSATKAPQSKLIAVNGSAVQHKICGLYFFLKLLTFFIIS